LAKKYLKGYEVNTVQKKHFSHWLFGSRQIQSLCSALALSLLAVCALPSAAHEVYGTDVPRYDLAIAFDIEAQQLKGTAVVTIPADLPLVVTFSSLEIGAVELDGASVPFGIDGISVEASPTSQKLTVHYRKSFQEPGSELISSQGIALTGVWHPLLDHKSQFFLQATVPNDFEAISEADTIQKEVSAAGKTFRFTFKQPLQGIHFAAGPYSVEEQVIAGNGVVVASYFFEEDKELAAHYRQKAQEYIIRYEKLIGAYPYKRFSIVENRYPTGYAMPSLTLLGQMVVRLPFIVDTSLGHEVLHSWFGNAVGVDYSSGNWCEGLTTYLADQAYAEEEGKGVEYRKGQLLKNQYYVHGDEVLAIKDFAGGDGRRTPQHLAQTAVGYGKVSMLFHMLAQKVGRAKFEAGIRDFYQRLQGKTASWSDIQQSFAADGPDMDLFFSQWLDRVGLPQIYVTNLMVEELDGDLTLSFSLQQRDAEEPYLLDVPIELATTNARLVKSVLLTGQEQYVEFKLADYPVSLVVDPAYDVARQLRRDEIPPSWDWFKGAPKKLAVVGTPSDYDLYEPLIEELEQQGAEVIAANEVNDVQLSENAVIFLGAGAPVARGLFAQPGHPEQGFVVDVRSNPLNPYDPAVLVSASSLEEVKSGLAKLKHYGKYCYLHFEQGRAQTKKICESENGAAYGLEQTPLAMEVAKAKSFAEIVDELLAKKVIYVGEVHNRYQDHQLQLRMIRELYQRDPKLVIGMEMFPRSSQEALDQFVAGEIDEVQFLINSKYYEVWNFDYRFYRGILNFARSRNIPVIGLNIDRQYVSKVYKEGGVSALGPEELQELPADRDLDIHGYRERIYSVFGQHSGQDTLKVFNGFYQAQAIWDEIMAETIANYINEHPEQRMVVVAGSGHVDKENAIPPRVARRSGVSQAIVLTSDGAELYPDEVDYLVFMPKAQLPQAALMGIVMVVGKESEHIRIEKIAPKSPAENGGVKENDLLLALDGKVVKSIEAVKVFMMGKRVGEKVVLTVQRARPILADETIEIELQL
jgi:uncharacterized iron-regulated protein